MIYMTQADTFGLLTKVKHCSGVAVDLFAAEVRMIIKKDINDDDDLAIATKSVVHPESNEILFQLSADETAAIPAGQYLVGVKIFFDSGVKIEIGKDVLVVEKGVFNG